MPLNNSKTKVMAYFKKKTEVLYINYSMNGTPIKRVKKMSNLGTMFDTTFITKHGDQIVIKARGNLGNLQ